MLFHNKKTLKKKKKKKKKKICRKNIAREHLFIKKSSYVNHDFNQSNMLINAKFIIQWKFKCSIFDMSD